MLQQREILKQVQDDSSRTDCLSIELSYMRLRLHMNHPIFI